MRCIITTYQQWSDELDLKSLITDSNLRRRMSLFVKKGVATGIQSIVKAEERGVIVDSVITATGLGCLEDTEKFLRNYISSEEQQLNPTPFIQSTHNTIGGQIALIKRIHGYNLTFSHRRASFITALMDALLLLHEKESDGVLLGAVDEVTPTLDLLLKRLGWNRKYHEPRSVCAFFVLSAFESDEPYKQDSNGILKRQKDKLEDSRQMVLELSSAANFSDIHYDTIQTDDYSFVAVADSLVEAIIRLEQGASGVKIMDGEFNIYLRWHF